MPTNLNNLKSKVDKLNIDKLTPVPVGLSKLSNVEKNDSVEKSEYNAKIENIEDKIPHVTNLATKTTLKAKLNPEIPSIITSSDGGMGRVGGGSFILGFGWGDGVGIFFFFYFLFCFCVVVNCCFIVTFLISLSLVPLIRHY